MIRINDCHKELNYFEILNAMIHEYPEVDFMGDNIKSVSKNECVLIEDVIKNERRGHYISEYTKFDNIKFYIIAIYGFTREDEKVWTLLHEVGHHKNITKKMPLIEDEVTAWWWALNWLADNGYELSEKLQEYVKEMLGSYIKECEKDTDTSVLGVWEYLTNFSLADKE